MKGVVVKFYSVKVAYYVPPCYEVKSFEAIGAVVVCCIRVCEQSIPTSTFYALDSFPVVINLVGARVEVERLQPQFRFSSPH